MDFDRNDIMENAGDRGALQFLMSDSSSSSSSDSSSASSGSDNFELFDSSNASEEENEDEEMVQMFAAYEEVLFGAPQARVEQYLEVVREKTDEQFRKHFRLHRHVAYELIDELDASGFIPNHPGGKEKKSAELSFLMFLWFVSKDSTHIDAAEMFGCGETTVFRIVRRVTEWILTIMPEHVIWPQGPNIQQTEEEFFLKAQVPKCIGAIDGSHIGIERPEFYGAVYWCRKEKYSILLQAVVDARMLFTNLHCGDPGSYHDIRMLRRSELYAAAERQLGDLFPDKTFLLGDKGYVGVGKKWIVTPFKDYGNLSAEQSDFNTRVSVTRVLVEQAFGILKARFRYLRCTMRLRDVHFAARLVVACCVLHNICIRSQDLGQDLRDEEEDSDDENDNDDGNEGPDSDSSDSDDDNEEGNRTLAVFKKMYPRAPDPANRRRCAVNADN
ncbi:putative nuclease HARBI1 [Frankliniella occidentalis]|uniref:Nuclease HARBI1 n=1 Tax=Frankliniella occidentalis TaxID=133901 RepID=A0A6J1TCZ4_FRAOC|nr:putative nuclease HARBI1 [Frankliniella occidentalis]